MKQKKVSDFVTFIPGVNTTRVGNQFGDIEINYYDQEAFANDYNRSEEFEENISLNELEEIKTLHSGDVVISTSLQLATIVSAENEGKVLSSNFIKVEFNTDKLDKNYFIYLFNEYSGVKRQKERELRGTGLILRIPINALNQITIPIISIEEQKKIGKSYVETLKMKSKLIKYSELMEKFVSSIIENKLKE